MKNAYSALLLLALFLITCAEDTIDKPDSIPVSSSLSCILFKEEQSLEVWINDSLIQKKIMVLPWLRDIDFPLGKFKLLCQNEKAFMQLDNDFYRRKDQQGKVITRPLLAPPDLLQFVSSEDALSLRKLISQIDLASLYIFPNDARQSGTFNPCIHCPRWTPELYSNLRLTLLDYQ